MTLPVRMIDRWYDRREDGPDEGTVYWHMLMRDQPEVVDLAHQAQLRLAPYAAGLHMTPHKWLHVTTLIAGPAAGFSEGQLQQMTHVATELLAELPPIPVTLGRILYHPEAIMLGVAPVEALQPIRDAALQATKLVIGDAKADTSPHPWTPHITICYSTADQPAQPLIDLLGLQLPEREIQIKALNLVVQRGPERNWDWDTVSTIQLTYPAE